VKGKVIDAEIIKSGEEKIKDSEEKIAEKKVENDFPGEAQDIFCKKAYGEYQHDSNNLNCATGIPYDSIQKFIEGMVQGKKACGKSSVFIEALENKLEKTPGFLRFVLYHYSLLLSEVLQRVELESYIFGELSKKGLRPPTVEEVFKSLERMKDAPGFFSPGSTSKDEGYSGKDTEKELLKAEVAELKTLVKRLPPEKMSVPVKKEKTDGKVKKVKSFEKSDFDYKKMMEDGDIFQF
jgi:hypothetical protein